MNDKMALLWDQLGEDERRVLCYLADRLLTGQMQYGKLDLKTDLRNFVQERKAEVGDLLVYSAFEALKSA